MTVGFESELKEMEKSLYKGEYKKISSIFSALEKWENITEEETLRLLKIKIIHAMDMGKYENASKFLHKYEQQSSRLKNDKESIEFKTIKIELLNYRGKFKEALKLILETEIALSKLKEKDDFYKTYLGKLLRLKGVCSRVVGETKNVKKIFEKSLILCKEVSNDFEKSNTLDAYAMYLLEIDPRKALKFIIESKQIRKKIGNPIYLSKTYNRLAIIQLNEKNFDEALRYYNIALELANQNEHKEMIAILNMNIGNVYKHLGKYNLTLESYIQAQEIYEKLNNQYLIANGLVNIADIYRLRGELYKALNNLEIALEVFENLGHKSPIAHTLTIMARVFYNLNDFKKSSSILERALDLRKEDKSAKGAVEVLFHLIQVSLDDNKLEKAKECLSKIEGYARDNNSEAISVLHNLAEAFVLKTSTRFQNRVRVEELLKKIINNNKADHEWILIAYVVLTDILLDELRISGEHELLDEIKKLTENLISAAKSSHSYFVLIETYRLQSQLSLIGMDFKRSKELLIQALLIAEEKQLHRYITKIGSEYDKLNEEEEMWKELSKKNVNLKKRISFTNVNQILVQMRKIEDQELKNYKTESPIYLLILDKNGKTLHTQKFLEMTSLDGALIGGFLAAINSFVSEIFDSSGHLERIKHQNYTLAIRVEESLIFTYVYKGDSFTAFSKLNNYVNSVKESNYVWSSLKDSAKTPSLLNLVIQKELEKKAEVVFLKS